jgi:hypothetical protein
LPSFANCSRRRATCAFASSTASKISDFGRAVEDRRERLEAEHLRRPAEVDLEDLADVHAAGHAQRVEQDVDRRAVLEERHVLFGHDAGDDALVAVTAGHLVADRELALRRDVDLDHLEHARRQFVAALHVAELALLLLRDVLDAGPELAVHDLGLVAGFLAEPFIHLSEKFSICSRMTSGMSLAPTF